MKNNFQETSKSEWEKLSYMEAVDINKINAWLEKQICAKGATDKISTKASCARVVAGSDKIIPEQHFI